MERKWLTILLHSRSSGRKSGTLRHRGRGTELISVYITPNYPLSDIMNKLRDEYGQAANIKSKTQKNVQAALEKIMAYLRRLLKAPGERLSGFSPATFPKRREGRRAIVFRFPRCR